MPAVVSKKFAVALIDFAFSAKFQLYINKFRRLAEIAAVAVGRVFIKCKFKLSEAAEFEILLSRDAANRLSFRHAQLQ
jgi:hypothetical protein